jgi:hypothetical protein
MGVHSELAAGWPFELARGEGAERATGGKGATLRVAKGADAPERSTRSDRPAGEGRVNDQELGCTAEKSFNDHQDVTTAVQTFEGEQ